MGHLPDCIPNLSGTLYFNFVSIRPNCLLLIIIRWWNTDLSSIYYVPEYHNTVSSCKLHLIFLWFIAVENFFISYTLRVKDCFTSCSCCLISKAETGERRKGTPRISIFYMETWWFTYLHKTTTSPHKRPGLLSNSTFQEWPREIGWALSLFPKSWANSHQSQGRVWDRGFGHCEEVSVRGLSLLFWWTFI